MGAGGAEVHIVDAEKAAVLDSFRSDEPIVSPDQHWIAYLKAIGPGVHTAEYLIYDLTKGPAQNRPDGDTSNYDDVGATIYPPGMKNLPGDVVQVPEEQEHSGGPLYWASDSRAIVFRDRLGTHPWNIVLVTLDGRGAPSAFEHQLTASDICGRGVSDAAAAYWSMERPEIGDEGGEGRTIVLKFRSNNPRCLFHVLQLNSRLDFQPAKVELYIQKKPTHGMKREGYPTIPPPQQ